MGVSEIIQRYKVKSENVQSLNLYFDSGSPYIFVKLSSAKKLGKIFKLPYFREFGGLGKGKFCATHIMEVEVELLGIWCRHLVYVVENETIEEDILIGHDFMQRYDIKLDTKKREPIIDKNALLRGLKVR